MLSRDVKKARRRIEDAGSTADQARQSRVELVHAQEIALELERLLRGAGEEFLRFLAVWLGQQLPADPPIAALAKETHQARQYRHIAIVAMLFECGLAWWTTVTRWGMPGYYGALAAAAFTLILHAIFGVYYEVGSTPRPREALTSLRNGPLRLGAIGLLISAATLVIARTVEGTLAVELLPLFNAGLATATLALLVTAGALFCAATIYGMSERLARRYDEIERRYRRTLAFIQIIEYQPDGPPSPPPPPDISVSTSAGEPAAPAEAPALPESAYTSTNAMTVSRAILPLLVAGAMLTGCIERTAVAAPPDVVAALPADICVVDVVVDTSGSVIDLDAEWAHLQKELPGLLDALACGALTLYRAEENGWSIKPIRTIPLPLVNATAASGEIENFKTVKEELGRRAAKERRDKLAMNLHELESATILPSPGYQSSASDIVGVIQRVSRTPPGRPIITVYLTDGADTKYREFPSIPKPAGSVQLLVLLAPANAKDSQRSTGRTLNAAEQYDFHEKQIKAAAPWVTVAPSHARDLATLLQ